MFHLLLKDMKCIYIKVTNLCLPQELKGRVAIAPERTFVAFAEGLLEEEEGQPNRRYKGTRSLSPGGAGAQGGGTPGPRDRWRGPGRGGRRMARAAKNPREEARADPFGLTRASDPGRTFRRQARRNLAWLHLSR